MPRKLTKQGELRFTEISKKGAFTRPKLIHKTQETLRKRFTLAGKVIKQYKGLVTIKEGKRLKNMTNNYQKILQELKIPFLQTRIILNLTKTKKFQLTAIQEYIPKELILTRYLKENTQIKNGECLRQALQYAKIIQKFNETHEQKITIDAKPDNFAIINKKLTLIDLYPPLIKSTHSINVNDFKQRLVSKRMRLKSWFFKQEIEDQIKTQLQDYFTPNYISKRILLSFIQANPKYEEFFKKIAQEEFKIHSTKNETN
ncbi:MAG: DUF6206 family protein [archaeon]|jgi:hypothetical protein